MNNKIYMEDHDGWETSPNAQGFKGHISNGWKAEFPFEENCWIDYLQHRPRVALILLSFGVVLAGAIGFLIYGVMTIPFGTLPPCPALNVC
jgi:hypothetical protein